jgi:hypothetical protein
MRTLGFAVLALALTAVTTNAAPVKLTKAQMSAITAGNPNLLPNGTIDSSNGASGAPGGSFKAPGQTTNPNPGK